MSSSPVLLFIPEFPIDGTYSILEIFIIVVSGELSNDCSIYALHPCDLIFKYFS
jgi:hypothetical protein